MIIGENVLLVQRLNDRQNRYGATDPTSVVQRHQSQARKRIVLFLSVFVISGFISEFLKLK